MTDQDIHMDDTPLGIISASSSASALNLAEDSLDELNEEMKSRTEVKAWASQIKNAERRNNRKAWIEVAAEVLMYLTIELAKTELKSKVIASPNLVDSLNLVGSFNEKEMQQWKSGMQSGFEENDWAGLIKHPKLRAPRVPNVGLGVQKNPVRFIFPISFYYDVHIPLVICSGLEQAIINAWQLPYHGNAHEILLRAIDEIHVRPIERNYAKIIPIAQSSGTGKSKTVDEVAKMRILFPMCLREDLGKYQFAYPPADNVVRTHFERAPSTIFKRECKQYFRSFLSALFKSAHFKASEILNFGGAKMSYEGMAKAFYCFFANEDKRNEFYESVVEKAKNDPSSSSSGVWNSLQVLVDGLKNRCKDWLPDNQCPLLISIDEVHVLYTYRSDDKAPDYTLYACLKSVLYEGVKHDFSVITLSTATHISSIAPSQQIPPSMRERGRERILPAPFTELPFDVYIIDQPLTPGQETLTSSVGSLKFTAKFGRPLFNSIYLSRIEQKASNIVEGVMCIVREKLSGRPWPPAARADMIDTSSIAVLSTRLLLDLSVATGYAKPYEEELVRNHLRILYSVYQNRQTFVTGSSPEPLIAEASAQIMNYCLENEVEPHMDLWRLLGQFVDHGLASQGAIGELIGRALSISAMDRAINRLSKHCELKYQTPVTVTDYYKALLTDDAWEALGQSIPANGVQLTEESATKPFKVAFQDAYFHFSHYVKASDSFPMQDKDAWAFWLRGTAVACYPNQKLTDRMTPIYFSGRGNVGPNTISVNLDQDQTSRSMNPANVAVQSAEVLQIFSHDNKFKLPYIAAVHCYASTEKQDISVTLPNPYKPMHQLVNDLEAPRYQIDFRGLGAYGNITNATRPLIQAMIDRSENAVFDNHSRRYGTDSVRRMLPVVSEDPACREWYKR